MLLRDDILCKLTENWVELELLRELVIRPDKDISEINDEDKKAYPYYSLPPWISAEIVCVECGLLAKEGLIELSIISKKVNGELVLFYIARLAQKEGDIPHEHR